MRERSQSVLSSVKKYTRRFVIGSGVLLLIIFGLLIQAVKPDDPIIAISQWSHWEVQAWFQQHNFWMPPDFSPGTVDIDDEDDGPAPSPASQQLDDTEGENGDEEAPARHPSSPSSPPVGRRRVRRGGLDGTGLSQLSLSDLVRAYNTGHEGDERMATRVYHQLQRTLLPPNPYWWLAPSSLLSLVAQTVGVFSLLACAGFCMGVRWVKKKVEQHPMTPIARGMLGLAPPQQPPGSSPTTGGGAAGNSSGGSGAAAGNATGTSGTPPPFPVFPGMPPHMEQMTSMMNQMMQGPMGQMVEQMTQQMMQNMATGQMGPMGPMGMPLMGPMGMPLMPPGMMMPPAMMGLPAPVPGAAASASSPSASGGTAALDDDDGEPAVFGPPRPPHMMPAASAMEQELAALERLRAMRANTAARRRTPAAAAAPAFTPDVD